jgi:fluoride ion exporter CrcB/FEX
VILACIFGGILLGVLLRRTLPERHLSSDAKEVIRLGTGLIGTIAALVLGLLIASAKSSYDTTRWRRFDRETLRAMPDAAKV